MRTAVPAFATHRRPLTAVGISAVALIAGCSTGTSSNGHGGAHNGARPTFTHSSNMHGIAGKGLMSTEGGYTLKPSTTALTVGEQTISFQVLSPQGMPQTEYVEDQTKFLHFYLVRLDLTGYQHLHPMLRGGTWSIKVDVAAPGPYRMFTDFIAKDPTGAQHPLVLSTLLRAPGTYAPVTVPPAGTTTTADGLTATLTGALRSGVESKVSFRITQDGRPVTDLEPYLDSFAHLTALHVGDLAYQHMHPELSATTGQRGGPTLPFSVSFPEAGTWRLFLQAQRAGKLHLLPLTVTVS